MEQALPEAVQAGFTRPPRATMLRRVIGKSGKITELTLAEVMRRVARNEFTAFRIDL
jgi:hypothetical protein